MKINQNQLCNFSIGFDLVQGGNRDRDGSFFVISMC
jgi:hypothetical protein